jgi:hypothetical protein
MTHGECPCTCDTCYKARVNTAGVQFLPGYKNQ